MPRAAAGIMPWSSEGAVSSALQVGQELWGVGGGLDGVNATLGNGSDATGLVSTTPAMSADEDDAVVVQHLKDMLNLRSKYGYKVLCHLLLCSLSFVSRQMCGS